MCEALVLVRSALLLDPLSLHPPVFFFVLPVFLPISTSPIPPLSLSPSLPLCALSSLLPFLVFRLSLKLRQVVLRTRHCMKRWWRHAEMAAEMPHEEMPPPPLQQHTSLLLLQQHVSVAAATAHVRCCCNSTRLCCCCNSTRPPLLTASSTTLSSYVVIRTPSCIDTRFRRAVTSASRAGTVLLEDAQG